MKMKLVGILLGVLLLAGSLNSATVQLPVEVPDAQLTNVVNTLVVLWGGDTNATFNQKRIFLGKIVQNHLRREFIAARAVEKAKEEQDQLNSAFPEAP